MGKPIDIPIKEVDLYQPVYDYLVAQGYTVRSEVKDCDMTALKDDELIVLELKRGFTISLLTQAVQRQKAAAAVYVVVPRPKKGLRNREWQANLLLLKRLELGLIFVTLGSRPRVEVVHHPSLYERHPSKKLKQVIIREMAGRSADHNQGGSTRRKLVTAYRENAVQIACYLRKRGSASPKQLRELGTGEKTQSILRRNVYGWFERIERGLYQLSLRGAAEIDQYPELVAHYDQPCDRSQ